MADQTCICVEQSCKAQFVITEGEQLFYKDKGYFLPRRCKSCRQARKVTKPQEGTQDNHDASNVRAPQWTNGGGAEEPSGNRGRRDGSRRSRRDDNSY